MKKKESSAKKIDLKAYKGDGDLSISQMKFGLWLSTNRKRIIRIIVIFLIISSATLFSYSSYHYVIYFLYGRQADKDLVKSLSENLFDAQAYRESTAPQILLAGPISSFNVAGKTDFILTLKNTNEKYYGLFDYCLKDAKDIDIACGSSFILPNSEKYLVLTAQDIERPGSTLSFQADNIFWQRLNNREIPDWGHYLAERINLQVTDIVYSKPDYNSRTPMHTVAFKIRNNSAYHFAKLPLDIILSNGSSITGVNVYNLNNLLSSETRDLKISWPAGPERATKVEVIPDVNILDPNVFLPYRG